MSEWLDCLLTFICGAILTFLEESVKYEESKFNKKVLKFLPIKHIFTAIGVLIVLVALCFYGFGLRTVAIILGISSILFLCVVIVIDCVLLIKKIKRVKKNKNNVKE